ncbi:MAG: 6-phosphogluconolactonase [Chloroflexota bacterium]
MVSEPEIVVLVDPESGAIEAAARIATILADAVEARARADWATTGGSTPVGIYRRLVAEPLVEAVPWPGVHVWWGDDRYVPRDHPQSNVKLFNDVVLDVADLEEGTGGVHHPGVHLPIDNVHPFRTGEAIGGGRGADWCAATLADELRGAGLAEQHGWPVFDLMLLGIGPDGHLLSVFPGSPAFDSTELAMAIPAPTHVEPHIERVTLNPAVIDVARNVIVVAYGSDKAATLAKIFGPERDPHRWPAQLARRPGATWILDEAAAAGLPQR